MIIHIKLLNYHIKSNQLKSGEIASIAICSFIFIVIILFIFHCISKNRK